MDHEFPRRRASDRVTGPLTPEVVADDLALLRKYTIEEFRKGDERMASFHRDLQANTIVTLEVQKGQGTMVASMSEVLEIMKAWKKGRAFLISIGHIAAWIMSMAGTVALTMAAIKGKLW
jgi:hypothetical protein